MFAVSSDTQFVHTSSRHLQLQEFCPSCGVTLDVAHAAGCDVARCVVTGMQRCLCLGQDEVDLSIAEGFGSDGLEAEHDGSCGQQPWGGLLPGTAEAVAHGWFARLDRFGGWVATVENDHDGGPDINRATSGELRWDRDTLVFVDRTDYDDM